MTAMRNYSVLISNEASSDLDDMVRYISEIYHPDSGHKYVDRVLEKLFSLKTTADAYRYSNYEMAKRINPFAKTLSIMNKKWTVVFHVEIDTVIVDRILPSKMMIR